MATQIFVNLPVKDLDKTVDFFTKMGYSFNPQFTDKNATCMIVGENIFVMLLVEPYFQTFSKKDITDTYKSIESIIALSADSRTAVDEIVDKALNAGATKLGETQNQGWMYSRGFQDINGHLWEHMYMDVRAIPAE